MKYSEASISKYLRLMEERIAFYMAMPEDKFLASVQLCISVGNEKIGKCLNVSQAPIFTCANSKECKWYCYDIKSNLFRKTVLDARARNTAFYKRFPQLYFDLIRKRMQNRRSNFFFRFHVAGDIPNMFYLENMVRLAEDFPHFTIWTYTKNYALVNRFIRNGGSIPENLKIMFSKWDGLKMSNPNNFPIFACKLEAGNNDYIDFERLYHCPGNCDKCKDGKGCIAGISSYADEH